MNVKDREILKNIDGDEEMNDDGDGTIAMASVTNDMPDGTIDQDGSEDGVVDVT